MTHPRSPRSKCSSGNRGQTTKAIGLKAEEGSRGMQAREGKSFQIKHPSPLHLMHCTNSAYRINGRITPKQCPHNLQPTLPPPARQ